MYGDGQQVRDWLYVTDHCRAIDTVLRHGEPGAVYNIGGDKDSIKSTTDDPTTGSKKKVNVEITSETTTTAIDTEFRFKERERPEVLIGKTYRVRTGYGNLFITINSDGDGNPFEVFAALGKSGGHFQEQTEAIARLISLALRANIDPLDVVGHLKGIRGPMITMTPKGTILSLPDAIGKILEEHISGVIDGIEEEVREDEIVVTSAAPHASMIDSSMNGMREKSIADYGFMPECPDCGNSVVMAEGCVSCKDCGYSRCL